MTFYKKAAAVLTVCLLFAAASFAQVKHTPAIHSTSSGGSIANGLLVYKKVCLSCHMKDGGGVPNMNPPLIKTTYVLGDKTQLITIVLNGLKDKIEIGDETFSNVMAPHADLKDQEIADVLTYVRKSFGNKASVVTALEVKKVRASIKK